MYDLQKIAPYIEKASALFQQIKEDQRLKIGYSSDVQPIISLACMMYSLDHLTPHQTSENLTPNQTEQGAADSGLSELVTQSLTDFSLRRTPYITVSDREWWGIEYDKNETLLEVTNKTLKALSAEWTPESYIKDGKESPFPGHLELDKDELSEFGDGNRDDITIFYKNNKGQYLRLDIDLEKDRISFELTTYFPNFRQGAHDLRIDFLAACKINLADIFNNLEKTVNDSDGEWDPKGDIIVITGADRYGKIEFENEPDEDDENNDPPSN